ncbi:LOW QUALITY PROTEIN: sentrin-specific protease 2-like [Cyrtonyx montezumae]|uniref:LOW QUALITY PROTEIN: sentrin-specific protease 2-like n=1 Tax=Cyrtonyx montezumae TaxID=9017 RepID=UPI0032DBA977
MYQWLLAAVSSLLTAARHPMPPPAPHKRPLHSVQPSLEEDADQSQAKRKKSAYVVSEADSSGEVNLPVKAADECWETSGNTISSTTDLGEGPSLYDSSIPTSSALGAEMLQIDQMPYESSAFFNRVTAALFPMTIPHVSTNRNGEHCTKPTPEDTLTTRPPIKEHSVPEPSTSGAGRAVRLHCAAEEDVQREEKEKYKQLLKPLKDKYAKYRPTPKPTSCNVQTYSRETVIAARDPEDQKCAGDAPQYMTLKAVGCSSHHSPEDDTTWYYTPDKKEDGKIQEKQASAGAGGGRCSAPSAPPPPPV